MTPRLGGQPIRRFAYLIVIAVLVLALAAALLLVGAGTRHLGGNGPIVFYRTDDARSTNTPFMVDPNGSHETALHDGGLLPGIWSPDGTLLAVTHLVADASPVPDAETAWIRPAVVNAVGTGFRILDAYPHRKMQLSPIAWSPDGSRIFAQSGGEDVDPADMGLYTLRASDGGDLSRIVVTPKGYNDHMAVSPDGSRVLVSRSRTALDGTLFVVNMDGTGRHELAPPHANAVDLQFYDGISDAWSPDGLRIAFCAFIDSNGSTGLFVVNPDGTDLKQLVSTAMGAVSVQWSPDGKLLAFTSEVGPDDQIAVIRPDGTGLVRLTDGADGSTSVAPVLVPGCDEAALPAKGQWPGDAVDDERGRQRADPADADTGGG